MEDPKSANYVFLPWVRQGAASGVQTPDSLGSNQAGFASVPVKLRVNNTPPDIERQVRLYGPGDVTGIDPQQVIRTEPRHLATDFEPNYFPAVEFDRPDFPWLFTPAKADTAGRLRPWLCLVVVRKQEGVTLRVDRNLPLPVLEIKAPQRELPDLSESWAWAHAQVAGCSLVGAAEPEAAKRNAASLQRSLAGDPALTVSRLLCPRRLDPLTGYLACVVPAFELGRKAGLALPIKPDDEKPPLGLAPAWDVGAQSLPEVKLPVYFHWEFRTGSGGDFESLVGLLTARDSRDMRSKVGKRLMDISQPGIGITAPPGTTLELEGALRVPKAPTAEWPEATRKPFQAKLKEILDAPWQAMKTEGKVPLVTPPIYGCWQAARHTVNITPVPSALLTWLDELNLDPRHRAIAALGTQVVQTQQEQMMASAWEQLGEIERVNQIQRQAQLARAVNAVYYARDFKQFSEEALLKVVAPAQSRVVVDATDKTRALLSQRISQTATPARAVSAPLRRLTSPRGAISARLRPVGAPITGLTVWSPSISIIGTLNTATIVLPQKKEAGLVTINQTTDVLCGAPGYGSIPFARELKQTIRFERASDALDAAPLFDGFRIVSEGFVPKLSLTVLPAPPDSLDAIAFRSAAKAHLAYLGQVFVPEVSPVPPSLFDPRFDIKEALLRSINPEATISARVGKGHFMTKAAEASLRIDRGAEPHGDPLEPILEAPDFPQPMYEAVRDLAQDFLFPGLEHVLPNTVTLLETNPKFVESFLVGLNAEMSHELLWRNYPTDQRGTYFRQFWGSDEPEIEVIKDWGDRKLGANARAAEQLVLLVRGELLRRYPNSVIYAVRAVKTGGQLDLSRDPKDELPPLFRSTLKPDVTFLGFNLKQRDAIADPGWFFVIQQQPTEPCFGMDVANFDKPPPPLTAPQSTWNDLSWSHLVKTEEELKALSHASIRTVLPVIRKVEWGKNSAHQAYITLQRPVRIAIHAKEMISQG